MYKRILRGDLIQEYDSELNLIAQDFESEAEFSEWEEEGKELTKEQAQKLNEKYPISEFNFIFRGLYQNYTIDYKLRLFREMANQLNQLGYYVQDIL